MQHLTLTPEEIVEKLKSGTQITFLDARNPTAWEMSEEKIPGAIRMTSSDASYSTTLPKTGLMVSYCTCPNDESAQAAAEALSSVGYPNVYVMKGGFEAWKSAGNPVELKQGAVAY